MKDILAFMLVYSALQRSNK